jgi:hypothetical protein
MPHMVTDAVSRIETNSMSVGWGLHLFMLGRTNPNVRWYDSRPVSPS